MEETNKEQHQCLLDAFNRQEVGRMVPVFIILGCIILIGCLGNSMSLYIYSRNFKDSNSRCFFILLSTVELFSSSVSVPMEIYNLVIHFDFTNDGLCKGFVFSEISQVNISCYLLVLIAVDRWRKVCHPFGWQISITMSKIFCFCIIPLSCVVAMPSFAIYGRHHFDMEFSVLDYPSCFGFESESINSSAITNISVIARTYKCSISDNASKSAWPTVYSGLFWFLSFSGTGLLTVMYVKIIRTVKQQDLKREQSIRLNENQGRHKYSKPKYRPRESIDMDCETDIATRTTYNNNANCSANIKSKHVSNYVDDGKLSEDNIHDRNDTKTTSETSTTHSPETVQESYTCCSKTSDKYDPALSCSNANQDILPKIQVIEVRQSSVKMDEQSETPGSTAMTNVNESVLLSPIMKWKRNLKVSFGSGTMSMQNKTGVFNESSMQSRDLKTSDMPLQQFKHCLITEHNKQSETVRTQNKQTRLSSHLAGSTLAPIEEIGVRKTKENLVKYDGHCEVGGEKDLEQSKYGTNIEQKENHNGTQRYVDKPPEEAGVKEVRFSYIGGSYQKENLLCENDQESSENRNKTTELPDDVDITMDEKDLSVTDEPDPLKKNQGRHLRRQSTKRQGRSRNVTAIMLAITISTIGCFLPYLILSLLRSLITDFEANLNEPSRVAYNVFVRSVYFKSVSNPIIYGLFDSRYRQVLLKILKGRLYKF